MNPDNDPTLRNGTGCALALFVAIGCVIFVVCVVGLIYGVTVIFSHIFKL